ncbi:MAG: hypothetical protein ACI8W8_002046, partial [Rhodothermales bacterium]
MRSWTTKRAPEKNTSGLESFAVLIVVLAGCMVLFVGSAIWEEVSREQARKRALTTVPAKVALRSDPTVFREHYYQVFETAPIEWKAAQAKCEAMGGYLVIISVAAENDFLSTIGAGNGAYHLGASDASEEGEWQWVDGTTMSYTNWFPGEPNNARGQEHYLTSRPKMWPKWNDESSLSNGSICEWDARPEIVDSAAPPAVDDVRNGLVLHYAFDQDEGAVVSDKSTRKN